MIKYQLRCDAHHDFEGWFRNSADYDAQAESGLLDCPVCGSNEVQKAIMAPSISTSGDSRNARLAAMRSQMIDAAQRAKDYVEKNFDHVGDKFPEEARKIHYGEVKPRGIYGEASGREVKDLIDEGIEVAPLPGGGKKDDVAGKSKPAQRATKKILN